MAATGTARGGLVIATVAVGSVAAFAWAAGFLPSGRLAPERSIAALKEPAGAVAGDRRNHARGVCVIGTFQATGVASAFSSAAVLMHALIRRDGGVRGDGGPAAARVKKPRGVVRSTPPA